MKAQFSDGWQAVPWGVDEPGFDVMGAILEGSAESLEEARERVAESARTRLSRGMVQRAEDEAANPIRGIQVDPEGFATVNVDGVPRAGGRFTIPTLGDLRIGVGGRARWGEPSFHLVVGRREINDVGALQAFAAPGTFFQVASQFNCLESPDPRPVAVMDYFSDHTQGPRAAISAFPGVLVRHYAAPELENPAARYIQGDERSLNLLEGVLTSGSAVVTSGYLTSDSITDLEMTLAELNYGFNRIRIGLHENIEVMRGANWDGTVDGERFIGQVCASTLAAGVYGGSREISATEIEIMRVLLRAQYLGAILGAGACGYQRLVLTLVGGGVFGNPPEVIQDAVVWAMDEAAALGCGPVEVVMNAYGLWQGLDELERLTQKYGGRHVNLGW
nr:hypothetical protein [Actinomycetales bacterium]